MGVNPSFGVVAVMGEAKWWQEIMDDIFALSLNLLKKADVITAVGVTGKQGERKHMI